MFDTQKKFFISKYKENETLFNILFFIGGVLFDIFTLDDIDSFFSIGQQLFYLILIGIIIYFDLIHYYTPLKIRKGFNKIWEYRELILHFMLGGLLSVYSLFFIKSASLFSSFGFISFMIFILVANELQIVQKQKISLKIGLYFICVFSFFSMIFPVVLGHVGKLPFGLSLGSTALSVWFFYRLVFKKIVNKNSLRKALFLPSGAILSIFLVFYYLGWIPPVPLSVKEIGVYHNIEKNDQGEYVLFFERSTWKFWMAGDENFKAGVDDKVYIFARIFSPARFDDTLYLNWQLYQNEKGWVSTDRIPIRIYGGRKEGFRGIAYKENYSDGQWRVLVETNDQREVGRLSFNITSKEPDAAPSLLNSIIR